jgi:hypothetical protein
MQPGAPLALEAGTGLRRVLRRFAFEKAGAAGDPLLVIVVKRLLFAIPLLFVV